MNPAVNIVVRTPYMKSMKPLYDLGADEVIPDEFGSSVEIFTRVLRNFNVPEDKVIQITTEIRPKVMRCCSWFIERIPLMMISNSP